MAVSGRSYATHFVSALIWVTGVTLFAFMPMLFLWLINYTSKENLSVMEIDHLLEGKVVIFTGCALVGAAVFSFITSPFRVQGWLRIFAIYVSPVCFLIYLFLKYLLIYVQFGEQHDYGPGTLTTTISITFSVVYSLLVKTILNIRYDNAGRHYGI